MSPSQLPIALVDYSDSDDSGEDNDNNACSPSAPSIAHPEPSHTDSLKRKRLEPETEPETEPEPEPGANHPPPPPPQSFFDRYFGNPRITISDDPSLHGGRTREVPHVVGNWPTHVQLEWRPPALEYDNLQALNAISITPGSNPHVPSATPEVTSLLYSQLGVPLPLHISLSRTLSIKTAECGEFVDTMRRHIRDSGVEPFYFTFSYLKWVPNYASNRWFLVLGIQQPKNDELNRLLNACNTAAERCGQAPLYARSNSSEVSSPGTRARKTRRLSTPNGDNSPAIEDCTGAFHISIASSLSEPSDALKSAAISFGENWLVKRAQGPLEVVKVVMGQDVHNIPLSMRNVNYKNDIGRSARNVPLNKRNVDFEEEETGILGYL